VDQLRGVLRPQAPEAGQYDLRPHYTNVFLERLRFLQRRRALIARTVLAGLAATVLVLQLLPRNYTAEAIVALGFVSRNANDAAIANIDATVLTESEAKVIASRGSARNIALALHDAGRGEDFGHPSLLGNVIHAVKDAILGERTQTDPVERTAIHLENNVSIATLPRSYLITIYYTASTRQDAAMIANAFAREFFIQKALQSLNRQEDVAQRETERLRAIYGAKFPALIEAQDTVDHLKAQAKAPRNPLSSTIDVPTGVSFVPANPAAAVQKPKGTVVLAVSGFASLALGLLLASLLESLERGFRTAREVESLCGIRCVGMIPETPVSVGEDLARAFSLLDLNTAITVGGPQGKVVLISSCVLDNSGAHAAANFGSFLVSRNCRVLHLVFGSRREQAGHAYPLNKVLASAESMQNFLAETGGSTSALTNCTTLMSPVHFDQKLLALFLVAAQKNYTAILIETAPLIETPDALCLADVADIHLHLVAWRETPRDVVIAAMKIFASKNCPVDGIVLIGVDAAKYLEMGEPSPFLGRRQSQVTPITASAVEKLVAVLKAKAARHLAGATQFIAARVFSR
jgi:capsular polysaccharide biosynthesis protein